MTQVSTTAPKPDTVAFGELAIAAGLAGRPVAVCFSESAASIDCELWRYFAQFAGPDRVLHVNRQADVNKLNKNVGDRPFQRTPPPQNATNDATNGVL